MTRASVSNTGAPADYPTPTFSPASISADGRYVAFDSGADNLAAGADNGGVFVRDTWAEPMLPCRCGPTAPSTTRAIRPRSAATAASWRSSPTTRTSYPGERQVLPSVPARPHDGRHDTHLDQDQREPGQRRQRLPSLSNDGRYIAFESDSPGLVAGDTNAWTDVFVRDRVTNTTKRVSVTATGAEADIGGESPSISADGRFVAFASSDILTSNDTNLTEDIYVRDMVASSTTLVSIAGNGAISNGLSDSPSISANGRFVVFRSAATNLDGLADTDGGTDVFVRDLVAGTTQRVSLSSVGGARPRRCGATGHRGDGRFVTYESTAADAVADDTNTVTDAFVYDRTLGQTSRVSTDSAGGQLLLGGVQPVVSADGRFVAFASASQVAGLPAQHDPSAVRTAHGAREHGRRATRGLDRERVGGRRRPPPRR